MSRACAAAVAAGMLLLASPAAAQQADGSCAWSRAMAEREAGRYMTARASFAACAHDATCGDRRDACAKQRDEVDRAIATVAFVVRDASGADLDARITLDADPAVVPLGRLVSLDPGVHEVRWSLPDGASGVQKVTAVEGEKARTVLVVVPSTTRAASPHEAAAPTTSRSPWPWVLVGGGATLLVSAAVFQLVAINQDSERKAYEIASTRTDLTESESADLRDSARSKYDAAKADQAIAITCGVLGGAAIVSGFTWILLRDRTTTVAATPTMGGVSIHGAF